jgi:hypothetical protein
MYYMNIYSQVLCLAITNRKGSPLYLVEVARRIGEAGDIGRTLVAGEAKRLRLWD